MLRLSKETRSMLNNLKKRWKLPSYDTVIRRMTKQVLAIDDELIELHSETHTDEKQRRAEIKAINFLKKAKAAFPYEAENFETRSAICMIAKQWDLMKLSIDDEDMKKNNARNIASLLLINQPEAIVLWRETYLKRYFPFMLDADEEKIKEDKSKLKRRRGRTQRLLEAKQLMYDSRLKSILILRKKLVEWDGEISKF